MTGARLGVRLALGLALSALGATLAWVAAPPRDRYADAVAPELRRAAERASRSGDEVDWRASGAEAASDLVALLRLDSSNPPGDTGAAARWLAARLAAAEIPVELVETAPGRWNVIGRLAGSGVAPPVLLVHHLDVVPAVAEEWRRPPFAGETVDGLIWGRGAVDDKGPTAATLAALRALRRQGAALDRDVVFLAVADEETGGDLGLRRLLELRPELARAGVALVCDGAFGFELEGQEILPVGVAEKASVALRVVLDGEGGHASVPLATPSPLARLSAAMARLAAAPQRVEMPAEVRAMLGRLGARRGGLQGWLLQRLDRAPVRALVTPRLTRDPLLAALTRRTVAWTGLHAGVKVNVFPGHAEALVDVRILPGSTPEETLAWVERTLALPGAKIEVLEAKTPSRSPFPSPWFSLFEAVAAERRSSALVVPTLLPGGTDARHTRPLGIPSYVAVPMFLGRELLMTAHNRDERLPAALLGEGARFLYEYLVAAAGDETLR